MSRRKEHAKFSFAQTLRRKIIALKNECSILLNYFQQNNRIKTIFSPEISDKIPLKSQGNPSPLLILIISNVPAALNLNPRKKTKLVLVKRFSNSRNPTPLHENISIQILACSTLHLMYDRP